MCGRLRGANTAICAGRIDRMEGPAVKRPCEHLFYGHAGAKQEVSTPCGVPRNSRRHDRRFGPVLATDGTGQQPEKSAQTL